jgi:hypothetical protein
MIYDRYFREPTHMDKLLSVGYLAELRRKDITFDLKRLEK